MNQMSRVAVPPPSGAVYGAGAVISTGDQHVGVAISVAGGTPALVEHLHTFLAQSHAPHAVVRDVGASLLPEDVAWAAAVWSEDTVTLMAVGHAEALATRAGKHGTEVLTPPPNPTQARSLVRIGEF